MSLVVDIYLIIINIVGFITYSIDKKFAIHHKYRIPEKILLIIGVFGGCIGNFLSMCFFHHKTRHIKFILVNLLFIFVWVYILFKIHKIGI